MSQLEKYKIQVRFSGDKTYIIPAAHLWQAQQLALEKFESENDLHPYIEEVHAMLDINHMEGF